MKTSTPTVDIARIKKIIARRERTVELLATLDLELQSVILGQAAAISPKAKKTKTSKKPSKQSLSWTPERRAAASVAMKQRNAKRWGKVEQRFDSLRQEGDQANANGSEQPSSVPT